MGGKRSDVHDLRKMIADMEDICREARKEIDSLNFSGARRRMTWLKLRISGFDSVATFVERDLRTSAFQAMRRIGEERNPVAGIEIMKDLLRNKAVI